MQRPVHTHGFTLLEILIAISIFGMVIGIAYSSYNASFAIINTAGKKTKTYAKAQTTMERIMGDLESLHIGNNSLFQGSKETISGHRADTLRFTSTSFIRLHPDDNPHGLLLISYAVEEAPDAASLLLYRSQNTVNADEDEVKHSRLLLCDNLQEIAFTYLDKDGEENESWGGDEGDNTSPLPSVISIRLRFNDSPNNEPGTLFTSALNLPMTGI